MKNSKSRQELLEKMLAVIRKNPDVRPSELNRILDCPHTAGPRLTLIKKGLVRKERKGTAVHYYPAN